MFSMNTGVDDSGEMSGNSSLKTKSEEKCLPHTSCHIPSVMWHLNAKEEGNSC